MSTLAEMCHCGHHKDTHFDGGSGDCLGIGCTACRGYRDATKPDPKATRPRWPNHAGKWRGGEWVECGCYDCNRYRDYVRGRR